jgi:hypothetical protein
VSLKALCTSDPSEILRRMKILAVFISATLVVAGIVHLLPALGVLGAERLASLYGIVVSDNAMLLLLRHRALLFGVLGLFMLHAAWSPPLQWWALAAGLVSTSSFVLLAWTSGPLTPPLHMVLKIDIALAAALAAALVLRWVGSR